MKKITIFFAAITFCCHFAVAQSRFRVAIFAMTEDATIGNGAKRSLGFVDNMFGNISAALDLPLETDALYTGSECDKTHLMQWLNDFECGSEDIVVFCYLGHGARSPRDTSMFPQMVLNSHRDEGYVSLEAVKNAIMQKGPRFCFVLGDLCNSEDPNLSPKFTIMNAAGNSYVNRTNAERIRKLFSESRGCVITTGSSKNEYSWANNDPTGPWGMVYTTILTHMFDEYVSSTSSECSWDDFLRNVKEKVSGISVGRNGEYRQNPIYRVERPRNPKTEIPKSDINVPKKRDDVRAIAIADQLSKIANDRNNSYDRITWAENIERERFANNADVKVVGRDNTTVLSVETAKEYLSRISTARRLRAVSVVDEEKNSQGLITKLTVHEIYIRNN